MSKIKTYSGCHPAESVDPDVVR